MSIRTLVWAFRSLPELNGETGLVECDADLAAKLIAGDQAQDPRVGDKFFRAIEAAPVPRSAEPDLGGHEYETTQLKPAAPKKRGK